MKILVADAIAANALEVLRAQPGWHVVYHPKANRPIEEEIRDADALIVRSATEVTAKLLAGAPKLCVVGRAGVGVDNVDLEAATRRGIVVMNTPGGNATSVAEHTLALLLGLARHIPQADHSLKEGKWEKKALMGVELRSKTLGLVGLGHIGMEVARLAQAYQMDVVACDPYVPAAIAAEHNIRLETLDGLLRQSDFISLHATLTPETRHLINARTLGLMKPAVCIVNCARGELVDEPALVEALESRRVAGAGLDVFESEPPREAAARLAAHPRVISTPHIAGSTEEAQEIVGIRIAEQVRDYLLNGVARNAVNMPSLAPEEYQKLKPYLELGEKLGAFLAQIASSPLEEVRVSYDGGLADLNTHLVRNAVLKGILNRVLDEPANLVNSGGLAQARGIEVVELRSARRAAFANSLGIGWRGGQESASALGMVGARNTLRILGINDIDIEAPLRGTIIYIRNADVPGVIGRVGTVLGNRGINIANFALGRKVESREAIGLVNVDTEVSGEALNEIRDIPAVRAAFVVEV